MNLTSWNRSSYPHLGPPALPRFFGVLRRAMEELEQAQQRAVEQHKRTLHMLPLSQRLPFQAQREAALTAFWSEFYAFVRVRREHIFEFPLKVALQNVGYITKVFVAEAWHRDNYACKADDKKRLSDGEREALYEDCWSQVQTVMLPLNLLRPLLVLHAWDNVSGSYPLR